ncbi:STAS domain-containing protein [Comamonas sp. UBA7840]|nr:STAS domain-containing protein [Comamonas sp. UBA7840]
MVRGTPAASASSIDPDSLSAREVLQESMVRKRRNEAIRLHEFAQLRLLRQRNEVGGQVSASQAAKDDALSSLLGQETRSTETLQKIDAIEAQMSGQWWRSSAQTAAKVEKTATPRPSPARPLGDIPVLGEDSVVQPAASAPLALPSHASVPMPAAPAAALPVFQPHPDLEEAAILFAHGDMDGARTRLLEQLVQVLSTEAVDEDKAAVLWHAVLDLCRATGDEEAFEPLAIDYAEHFGRSAPLWSSIPERMGLPALHGAARPHALKRQFQWSCPSMLTVGSVTALRAAQAEAPQPWSMSWLRLQSVDEAALTPLTQLLNAWSDGEGQFVLSDAGKLLQLLERHTPVGNAAICAAWWTLRMAVLRMMDRMDDYEQVALDYCVTYEVSPPSWAKPQCHCVVQEEGEADVSILQEASLHSAHGQAKGLVPVPVASAMQGLAGVIEGDPQVWLDALTAQAKPGQVLEVACDNLIRLDFVAAGGLLNWAAEMQNQGYILRFTQLHQLVAVFFHVIGIHEHATVQATLA